MNEDILTPIEQAVTTHNFPCLIPTFQIRNGNLYLGKDLIKNLDLQELLFLSCCDGEIDYESIKNNVPESTDYRDYFDTFLIDLPAKKEPDLSEKKGSRILVISPHGYEGYISMGSAIEDWTTDENTVEYLTCFSQQTALRKELNIGSFQALNLLRKDETELCARLCGTVNHQLNFPDHKYAQTHLFQDDFTNEYKKVSAALRTQLYKKILTINPDQIYFPAGLSNNRDGALIFELVLDFYKKSLFPSASFLIYGDFPFSTHYSAIDDLRIVLDERFVQWEECIKKTGKPQNINTQSYRAFSSLFKPSDKKMVDNLMRRNTILTGETGEFELTHFIKLIDKPLNQ
ncbi:MAG: LmbE family N-acetylglucosaminyl deacetylase [Crocinitomix sp.]|jgi:LmbE family N-acetylglucosaminyl deacetylase